MISMLDVLPRSRPSIAEGGRLLGREADCVRPHRGTFGFMDAQRSLLFAAGRKIVPGKGTVPEHRYFLMRWSACRTEL